MIIVELNEIKDLDVREINIVSVPSASQISAVAGTSSSRRFSTVPQGSRPLLEEYSEKCEQAASYKPV